MLYGSMAPIEASNWLTKQTANVSATDFRSYPLGSNTGEFGLTPVNEIKTSGVVSSKRQSLIVNPTTDGYNVVPWNRMPLVGTDDMEILALYSTDQERSGNYVSAGPALKILAASSNFIAAGVGGSRNSSVRVAWQGGAEDSGSAAFAWSFGTLYWTRLRIEATRNQRRKVWEYGNSEPGAFTDATIPMANWPTAAGQPGLLFRRSSSDVRESFIHYIAVAYNGQTAPFPWEIPA